METHSGDPVVEAKGVWKIFGEREHEALAAIRQSDLTKAEVLETFEAVVGVRDKLDPRDVAEDWVANNTDTVTAWIE